MNLRLKIAQSLPRDSVSLRALLSIASIEETNAVATACVTFGQTPRLLVNPKFVEQHADTPAKLQTLIGHELLHVALGHTRRYTTCSPLDNLVFDCIINSTLSRGDPTLERTALFRDFYSQDRFPECFLRPPDNWHPSVRPMLPRALRSSRIEGLPFVKDVYRRLWGNAGVSGSEIRAAILLGAARLKAPIMATIGEIPLLGGHDDLAPEPFSGELAEYFAEIVTQELSDKLAKQGLTPNASFPLTARAEQVRPVNPKVRRQLRGLFEHLAHGHGSARLKSDSASAQTFITPIPQRDRRAIVQRLLGLQPLLYAATDVCSPVRSSERIHIYLDVSGSMDSVMPALYGAMHDCRGWLHEKVHVFSTVVADISVRQLKSGVRITTHGTDINCVADHLRQHKIKRALIVTDGLVGRPSDDAAQVFRDTELVVAFAGQHVGLTNLAPFAKSHQRLLCSL